MPARPFQFESLEKYIFFFLLTVQVVLVWSLPVFITQDGPSHLYNASLLTDLLQRSELASRFFYINADTFPNWFSTIVLAILQLVFSPLVSEKIFVSLLIIGLALSFRFALKRIQPKTLYLSSFIFTFTYGYHLFLGFYNFLWGLAFLFLIIGLYQSKEKRVSILTAAILLVLIYFSHPVPFVFAVLFIMEYSIRQFKFAFFDKTNLSILLKHVMVLLLPCFLFLRFFLSRQASGASVWENKWNVEQFIALRDLSGLQSFSAQELSGLSLVFFVLLFVLLHKLYRFIRVPNERTSVNVMVLFIAAIILFFKANDEMAGGSNLEERLLILICLFGVLFSAQAKPLRGFREISVCLLVGIFVWLMPIRYRAHKACAKVAAQYVKAMDKIENGGVILPFYCSNFGEMNKYETLSPYLRIFNHVGCYAACKAQNIVLDNYEANTGYFPINWENDKNPYWQLSVGGEGGMEENPPNIDMDRYEKVAHKKIDYILQLGNCNRFGQHPNLIKTKQILLEKYQPIHQEDFVTIYKKK